MKTLKEMGISPVPWTATADADGEIMVNDENRYGIAAFGFVAEGDMNYANARLTAAAPELYEALREICTVCAKPFGKDARAARRIASNILAKWGYPTEDQKAQTKFVMSGK